MERKDAYRHLALFLGYTWEPRLLGSRDLFKVAEQKMLQDETLGPRYARSLTQAAMHGGHRYRDNLLWNVRGVLLMPQDERVEIMAQTLVAHRSTQTTYAIGVQAAPHEFGMKAGPFYTVQEAIDTPGSTGDCIIAFRPEGGESVLLEWSDELNKWDQPTRKEQPA
jgi:hypothetical protein